MKKVVSITEADLKRIVKKVLKEQAQSQPSVYTSSTFKPRNYGSLFDLGKYQDESGKIRQAIEKDKQSIVDFMNSQDKASFTAKIDAGESLVTNPVEFKQKGSLALARAKTIFGILNDVYADLIADKKLKIVMPNIGEVVIGKTPYKSGDQNDPSKLEQYKKEQYVSMSLEGQGKTLKCNTPLPVKGRQGVAPDFEFVYNEELLLNAKIKGISYVAFTIPDRPIMVNSRGEKTSPPYFVREKESETSGELKFPLELALKSHIYPNSQAFANIEFVDAYREKILPYLKGGIASQQTVGIILAGILKNNEANLTQPLKQLYGSLTNAKNTLTMEVFNANSAVLKDVFSKSPRIVTNPDGTPFNVNMQQTPSIKIGSYAPLENTIFQITPFC
jgi:hypothetical protein